MKHRIDLIKTVYIILTIIMLFTCQVLRFYRFIDVYTCSIAILVAGAIGLITYIIDKIINVKKIDIYDILIIILVIFGIISTIYAINQKVALFGTDNRNEGLLVLITYYIIFLVTKSINNKKYKNIIINAILIYGLLHTLYGICQYFRINAIFKIPIIKKRYYSTGLEINPNFFATIAIVSLSIALSKSLINKEKDSIIYTGITPIFFMGVIVSGAMSANLTLVIIIPILLIILAFSKPKIKTTIIKLIYIVLSSILCFNLFNNIDNNYLVSQFNKTQEEINNVAHGTFKDEYGTGRIYIWRNALDLSSKNLINGIGIDNFLYGYDKENRLRDMKNGFYIDKVHNEYLQKLVTEGIFSLITYMLLLLLLFIKSIKKITKNKDTLLITLFISFLTYAIQAFFNISVICVAPLFYILMGLLASEAKNEST